MRWISIIVAASVLCILLGCREAPETVGAQEPSQPESDITEFVRQTFIEGVPYEEADRFDAQAVEPLAQMLQDPSQEEYWSNVVTVLGIIGNEEAVGHLLDFLNEPSEQTLSPNHFRAKTSALVSLGYAVNKSGIEEGLTYLMDSMQPSVWDERAIGWSSPFHSTSEERNAQLSKMAILALGLSGHDRAAEALTSLQESARSETATDFQAEVQELVAEALEANRQIASQGLAEYYRQRRF